MGLQVHAKEAGFAYSLENAPKPVLQSELAKVADWIKRMLPYMSKAQLEDLTTTLRHHYMTRFKKQKRCKYGNINRGFTEKELEAFLHAVDSPKLHLLYRYQAILGLRVGEAVKVNLRDIKLESQELLVRTEKARTLDTLKIPLPLYKETMDFIHDNAKQIEQADGYIFYRDPERSNRQENWLEVNYVRNRFRFYLEQAHLDETYDVSEESGSRKPRALHRLTTHSLRHYAITKFARTTNGNLILTARFARHLSPEVTQTYINTSKQEIYDVIDAIAINDVSLLKKKLD